MSVDILERTPGTREWLRRIFTPRVELAIRRHLRELQRVTDASAAAVWIAREMEDEVLGFAGDRDALPRSFGHPTSSVPSYEEIRLPGHLRELMVVAAVQLGRELPVLRLGVVAPSVEPSPALLEAVGAVAEAVEEIVVAALG